VPVQFPPLESATPEGLLAIGGNLDIETLYIAYTSGIFPWPVSDEAPLTWFSPNPRGILDLNEFHLPRSFQKFLKKSTYTIKYNKNFIEIINSCADMKRKHEQGTWISQEILDGYINLFNNKLAYCVGIYEGQELIGGLYGVCFGEIFSGESMFHSKDNASKLALYHLVEKLKAGGVKWIDTQMVSPLLELFGGKEVPRLEFINKLKKLDSRVARRDEIFQTCLSD
jgi:leucyl/phenylalanyl-tRNA--protein transferase